MVDVDKLEKLYYSIGEVADMMDVSKSLIRYWENEFDFLSPKKNIQQLLVIYELVKERGFTLDGARQEIKKERKKLLAKQQIITRLQHVRNGMQDLLDGHLDGE